jgi:hypothetical protein
MTKQDEKRSTDRPWSFPVRVEDVPETGLQVALSADEPTRNAIAKIAGLRGLPRLEATFDVIRLGGEGLHVSGEVKALVDQTCVVTLEPIQNEINEVIDLDFRPDTALRVAARHADGSPVEDGEEPPEQLIDGVADLGAVATEFLFLGIDPYPRKPGAVFKQPPAPGPETGPFAALSKLQTKRGSDK